MQCGCEQMPGTGTITKVCGAHAELILAERERSRFHRDRDARLREISQRNWIEAAETAITLGDFRPLKLRVDLAKAGPIDFVETKSSD